MVNAIVWNYLLDFKNAMPTATIHVVCNQFFFYSESISDFKIYDQSKVKKDIESSGGKSLLFPSLTTRISNRIYNDRMTIEGGVGGQNDNLRRPCSIGGLA